MQRYGHTLRSNVIIGNDTDTLAIPASFLAGEQMAPAEVHVGGAALALV